jgi:hypothetical protein
MKVLFKNPEVTWSHLDLAFAGGEDALSKISPPRHEDADYLDEDADYLDEDPDYLDKRPDYLEDRRDPTDSDYLERENDPDHLKEQS